MFATLDGMRNLLKLSAVLGLLLFAPSPAHAQVSFGFSIGEPPAPRRYVVPARPGPDYVWVEGYWYPQGNRYAWHNGYWSRPPIAGGYWVEPYYSGGRWVPGYWENGERRFEHDHRWDRQRDRDYRQDRREDRR
jgi:hypothetical protein